MVESGNGDRFFFDFGPGCIKNILAMGVARLKQPANARVVRPLQF
jgi:hypothetical protein